MFLHPILSITDETSLCIDPSRNKVKARRGCKYSERVMNSTKVSVMFAGTGDRISLINPMTVGTSTISTNNWKLSASKRKTSKSSIRQPFIAEDSTMLFKTPRINFIYHFWRTWLFFRQLSRNHQLSTIRWICIFHRVWKIKKEYKVYIFKDNGNTDLLDTSKSPSRLKDKIRFTDDPSDSTFY